MKINEVAKLTGVTVRALHYYDSIGLLTPKKTEYSNFRIYDNEDLARLQQILFFRELDFSLDEIKLIMKNENYDKNAAFIRQKELLVKKRDRLNNIIKLVENNIVGDDNMSFKEFDNSEIEKIKNEYAQEAKEKWGNTDAYKEYEEKTNNYDSEMWKAFGDEGVAIMKEFAANKDESPESDIAKKLVKKWQKFITNKFYNCTNEILSGLGQMYIGDERFTNNIDQFGKGTAQFMSECIKEYCK